MEMPKMSKLAASAALVGIMMTGCAANSNEAPKQANSIKPNSQTTIHIDGVTIDLAQMPTQPQSNVSTRTIDTDPNLPWNQPAAPGTNGNGFANPSTLKEMDLTMIPEFSQIES